MLCCCVQLSFFIVFYFMKLKISVSKRLSRCIQHKVNYEYSTPEEMKGDGVPESHPAKKSSTAHTKS